MATPTETVTVVVFQWRGVSTNRWAASGSTSVANLDGMFSGCLVVQSGTPLSDKWKIDSVTSMNVRRLFSSASAFDQDLGWCVDDGAGLRVLQFLCYSTSCGVNWMAAAKMR